MQDAMPATPQRESLLPTPLLQTLNQLNRRFLDLACDAAAQPLNGWALQIPADLAPRFVALGEQRREALSHCPYALFDVRFCDEPHWEISLQSLPRWRVQDAPDADLRSADFLQLALFFCWHLAQTQPLCAPLILGMGERIARELGKVTLDRLPGLMAAHRHHLGLRWPHCRAYWRFLTGASPGSSSFQRAQLFGLQIAAAVRLGQ